jgi:hypothetical protein
MVKFILKQPTQILMFSYIGESQEKAATATTVNVKLMDDSIELEGVVVGALGIKEIEDAVTCFSNCK